MKYKPEPVEEEVWNDRKHLIEETHWDVEFGEGEGYIFEDQDDAMMFCLLLEIRDFLKESERTKRIREELEAFDNSVKDSINKTSTEEKALDPPTYQG